MVTEHFWIPDMCIALLNSTREKNVKERLDIEIYERLIVTPKTGRRNTKVGNKTSYNTQGNSSFIAK